MSAAEVEVLVVGAGQAGVAMSEHLGARGISHLVLERDRIAERWRTGRWDSLVANGPAWHDRFPGREFSGVDPDGFASKDRVADYFSAYVDQLGAPVRCGVEVRSVTRNTGRPGFAVETSEGVVQARCVVAATGPFQTPVVPAIVPEGAVAVQIHSSAYRNPQQLPEGGVLVVGAGSSGVQIAEELQLSGRRVHLSVGPHQRPPRGYRGRDFCWWLGVLNKWDAVTPPQGADHVTIAVSGARGGHTVDFRELAEQGVQLVGRTSSFQDGVLRFTDDLRANVAAGDASYASLLDEADAHVEHNGLDLPEEPEARAVRPDPESITDPVLELDLAAAGITSIIWATGYAFDYRWLPARAVDGRGRPQHQRGVSTTEPGLYFLGLPWQSRRGSSFIWGVWHDAGYVAEQIAIQRSYLDHDASRAARASSGGARDLRATAAPATTPAGAAR